MQDIKKAVLGMCRNNLAIGKGEKVLVMSDYVKDKKKFMKDNYATGDDAKGVMGTFKLAKEVYRIIKEKYPNTKFWAYEATGSNGREPGKDTAKKMLGYDVIIILSYYSMTHTDARQNANREGARIASMPHFERKMFLSKGPMDQDYNEIDKLSERIANKLTKASKAYITAPNGTEVYLDLGNKAEADIGIIKKGKRSNLPAGEAYTVPKGGRGILVISKGWFKGIEEDLVLKFEEGLLISVEGNGEVANGLRKRLFEEKHRRVLAELGIGTNPGAGNPTNVLESEKIKGTIHIAFGDSSHMLGGFNVSDSHLDFVLDKATVRIDNELLIHKGKLLL